METNFPKCRGWSQAQVQKNERDQKILSRRNRINAKEHPRISKNFSRGGGIKNLRIKAEVQGDKLDPWKFEEENCLNFNI